MEVYLNFNVISLEKNPNFGGTTFCDEQLQPVDYRTM